MIRFVLFTDDDGDKVQIVPSQVTYLEENGDKTDINLTCGGVITVCKRIEYVRHELS